MVDQRRERGWKGLLVNSANCTSTQLVLLLKPLFDAFEQPPEPAAIPSWDQVQGDDARLSSEQHYDPIAAKEAMDAWLESTHDDPTKLAAAVEALLAETGRTIDDLERDVAMTREANDAERASAAQPASGRRSQATVRRILGFIDTISSLGISG